MLTRSTKRLLNHLVSMVTIWQANKQHSGALFKCRVPESIQAKIPNEWNYTPLEAKGKEAGNNSECALKWSKVYHICFLINSLSFFFLPSFFAALICLTVQTLSFIFANLPALVASLPLPLHYLFLQAEKKLTQHSRHLHLVGLPSWALLRCLIQSLEDLEALGQISGLTLERGAKEPLALLAECLQFLVGIQQKVWSEVIMLLSEWLPWV